MEHFYIYCIHNDDLPEYYVGHTKNVYHRWHKHKNKSKTENYKVYQYINNNGGIDNFKMEVLDEIYCSLEEAAKLEDKIYYQKNKEKLNKIRNERYHKNKDEINEKRKEKFICICGSTLRDCAKQRHFRTEKHIQFIRENIGF